eukprot:3922307-Ditylum_brightwellii.AAC.1
MACHSLDVAVTVVAEQTRSGAVIVVHISRSMHAWFVFLFAAFNIKSFFRFFFALLRAAVTLVLTK